MCTDFALIHIGANFAHAWPLFQECRTSSGASFREVPLCPALLEHHSFSRKPKAIELAEIVFVVKKMIMKKPRARAATMSAFIRRRLGENFLPEGALA
jgi:hypothetical protein